MKHALNTTMQTSVFPFAVPKYKNETTHYKDRLSPIETRHLFTSDDIPLPYKYFLSCDLLQYTI